MNCLLSRQSVNSFLGQQKRGLLFDYGESIPSDYVGLIPHKVRSLGAHTPPPQSVLVPTGPGTSQVSKEDILANRLLR